MILRAAVSQWEICSTSGKKRYQPNRTITGRFSKTGPINNVISAQYSFSTGFIHVNASFPLMSNISVEYSSRGSWVGYDEIDPDRWDQISQDFEDEVMKTTFKVGESSWKLAVGWGFSAQIIRINWYIEFTEFSDSQYKYKKGIVNGDDFY